jgi:hypothetical protein
LIFYKLINFVFNKLIIIGFQINIMLDNSPQTYRLVFLYCLENFRGVIFLNDVPLLHK